MALHEPVFGGATRSVVRLVPLLEPRGWRFVLWAPRPSPLFDELRDLGHDVRGAPRHIPYSGRALLAGRHRAARDLGTYAAAFRRTLRDVRPALVHANTLFTLPEGLMARGRRIPTVWHVHEMLPATAKSRLLFAAGRRAGMRPVAVSAASAAALPVPADVVHECAPVPAGTAARPPHRRPLVVGTVGVVSTRKGSDLFVAAAERVLAEVPDVEFRLVGAPTDLHEVPWAEGVLARARAAGVRHLLSADVPAELAEWDVFVLPSRRDPFPISLLEAMASGLPVVGTAVDGLVEQVTPETGILAPPGDVAALTDAIRTLLARPGLRAAMGAAGRARVLAGFTLERQAEALERVYLDALDPRP